MEMTRLVEMARRYLPRAYAPYSGYRVAAALLTVNGDIYTGVNIENSSFGLTLCAERGAVAAAVTAGVREFTNLAVVSDGDVTPLPCGACLQVLREFAIELKIGVAARDQQLQLFTLGDLLPHSFVFNFKK